VSVVIQIMLLYWLAIGASDSSSIPSSYAGELQTAAISANPDFSFFAPGSTLESQVQSSDSSIPSPYGQDFSDNAGASTPIDFSPPFSGTGSELEPHAHSSDSSIPSPYGQDFSDNAAAPTSLDLSPTVSGTGSKSFLADRQGQDSDSSIPSAYEGELILVEVMWGKLNDQIMLYG